jgi:hypothetical protein
MMKVLKRLTYKYCVDLNNANITTKDATVSVKVYKNSSLLTTNPKNQAITVNRSSQYCGTASYNIASGTVTAGDKICATTTVTPTSQSNGGPTTTDPPECQYIYNKPVFKVLNSSVVAGQCSSSALGSGYLASWFNNQSTNIGASTNLATFSSKPTVGFASAQNNSTPFGSNDLTFFQYFGTSIDNDSPNFGGSFSPGLIPCLKDATQSKPASNPSSSVDLSSSALTDGEQSYNGNITITGGNNFSKHLSIFANGDVTINTDIIYAGADTWTSSSDIPRLIIRAKGNIYIDNNVKQLDGLYIAKPKDVNSGGAIYTCTNNGVQYATNALYNNCQQPLKVYGVFIANKINLQRTYKSLRNANNMGDAAEQFYLSPEIYLNGTNLTNSGGSTANTFDALYRLPPVF